MPLFRRHIGIDYSGAETAEASLKGIRVYAANPSSEPEEVPPPAGPRKYWSRRALAGWLLEQLSGEAPAIVGIDHAFSFPLAYFQRHRLPLEWPTFLNEFQSHCPTDEPNTYVDFVRNGMAGCWDKVTGEPSWLRLTEQWTASAKSVFQFDVQGAVAKATYAGLPWLRYLRRELNGRVHFWPFDGWDIPHGRSVIAEVHPSLWMKRFSPQERNSNQHAAYSLAAWLRRADLNGSLSQFVHPELHPEERKIAEIEGWILGVV
jgi:hypothetical protein